MILKLKNQNMAASKAVAFQSLACVWFCVSTAAAVQNCSLVNCKVLPVGENIASEFRLKASEKGVRMIYLNLKIGNNSYNPLELQDEFQPDRWVWARSNKEPMLSLPYDYDILSLGLLNYQVRSMTVPLRDEPSGCLAGLNSTCQNMAVGRALLDNVTMESNSGVVCVAMIEKTVFEDDDARSLKYHCCRLNASSINCDVPVEGSNWYQAIQKFLIFLAIVLIFYFPGLLPLLPDYIFDLQYECDKEKEGNTDELNDSLDEVDSNFIRARNGYEEIPDIHNVKEDRLKLSVLGEIPVDDASPVTCSTAFLGCIQQLPDVKMSFNLKLAVLLFCIFPFGFYVNVVLFFVLKEKYFDELFMKVPLGTSTLVPPMFFSIYILYPEPFQYFLLASLALTCSMAVFFLRPTDLFLNQDFTCWHCELAKCFSPLLPITDNEDSVSIGDKMLHHLNIIQKVAYFLMFEFLYQYKSGLKKLGNISTCRLKVNHNGSRIRRALVTVWILFSSLVTLFLVSLVWVVIASFFYFALLLLNLVFFSPYLTLSVIGVIKIGNKFVEFIADTTSTLSKVLFFCLFTVFAAIYSLLTLFTVFIPVFMLCSFFVGILGFTIMGLVLNVETVTPYAAFFVVVVTNIYFCYANLQKSYMEVKGFILKYWQQEMQATLNSEHSTIPAKLFWFVSDKVFPVKTKICLMLGEVAVIVTFLFLTISSIIFFKNEYEISTLVSTIAVFLSGAIPSLFFKGLTKGKKFTGWRKIKLKKKIEAVVTEYVQEISCGCVNRETEEGGSSIQIDNNIVA